MKSVLVALAALGLGACAGTAELYPANDLARSAGPLKATFIQDGTGSGPITVTMPDGEILKGRYSVNVGGSTSFGSIYASAYGSGGFATGSGFSTGYSIPNGSPGSADLYGPRGSSMQCEFYNNNLSGHGNGGCRTAAGAIYRLQY